ncbi:MAG: ATP-binding protein [Rhodocyclaceae bacterium]|nr:ATP-binding protein [Rhodocyclaceae bacterium]
MTPALAPPDEGFIDVLASGVHDTKNTLFDALSRIDAVRNTMAASAAAPTESVTLLDEAYVAVERSAERLAKLLSAYRLIRRENPVVLLPTPLGDLAEYVRLRAAAEWQGTAALVVGPVVDDVWIMDRELIADCLVNALTNAARYAGSKVTLELRAESDWLSITVVDDGPGYAREVIGGRTPSGSIGLFIADKVANLHERNGQRGTLALANGPAGGAVFTLTLP